MSLDRDGHVHVLPLHVANKIAAGEVVERPASVVKELVENALDAGAKDVRIAIAAGGRKLISVQDDGCGMTKEDALLSLERQATSKILDVDDIERIDTLGFRGEAVPSIASVSRFTLTTRRADADEGTQLVVNAGALGDVRAAGCPPGTRVEVRDLFCNVPARRKFLHSTATEESHVKAVFTAHALAHPQVGFALSVDGRELYRLPPAEKLADRVRDLFGPDFLAALLPVETPDAGAAIRVTGFLERPNRALPSRRDQYIFVNGRPASAPAIAYALREAYPRRPGDVRPAAILFLTLPPGQVDVNVHPTKREVRFRDNGAVKRAFLDALEAALKPAPAEPPAPTHPTGTPPPPAASEPPREEPPADPVGAPAANAAPPAVLPPAHVFTTTETPRIRPAPPAPRPAQIEFAVSPVSTASRPWAWFHYLATTETGYLLLETDSGVVTVNPRAARERIVFERLAHAPDGTPVIAQTLLIPDVIHLPPAEATRLRSLLDAVDRMGFKVEEFGHDTFKVDAVPQIAANLSPAELLTTIAHDCAENSARRTNARWREELIARSVARSCAGASDKLTREAAVQLVEELASCRMPYVCPRGKPIMIFTSTRELNRKFGRE